MNMLKITATAAIATMILLSGCGTSESSAVKSPEISTTPSVERSETHRDTTTTTPSEYSQNKSEAEYKPSEEPTEPSVSNQTPTYNSEPSTTYEPRQSAPTVTTPPEDTNPNGYDMSQYSDGYDLYDDYSDDFEDEEEAEDYYDDYGD